MSTRPSQPAFHRVAAFVLPALLASLTGCSTKPVGLPEAQPDRPERLTRGCVFYLDGAGGGTGKSNYAGGVVEGMLEAGYNGAGEMIAWETGEGLMADQKASVAYKRAKAREIAAKVQNYKKAYPDAPAGLLGFSAGTAEAVFALETLPETMKVDAVVLLGASISHDYDLTRALKRVKNKLHVFTSPHDHMLSLAMPLSGTADRKYHDAGAGTRGFSLPSGASGETRRLYAEKIVTIPYSRDFRKDGDRGHHFDNVKGDFIRDHVAPLLMGAKDSDR